MTNNDITIIEPQGRALSTETNVGAVKALYDDHQAANTRRTYRTGWQHFCQWCEDNDAQPLPADPQVVALYLTTLANATKEQSSQPQYSLSTIRTYRAAIADAHANTNHSDPTGNLVVKRVLKGIARQRKEAKEQQGQAAPALASDVTRVLDALGDSLPDLRDKALIAVARSTLARRGELVAIEFADIDRVECVVTVHRKKTGKVTENAMTLAACAALNDWLEALEGQGISEGFIFRRIDRHGHIGKQLTEQSVNLILKRAYERAGLKAENISGHSARVGMAQDLMRTGADIGAIATVGGWSSTAMPLRYTRKQSAKASPVAALEV